jgi:hypothetical protein
LSPEARRNRTFLTQNAILRERALVPVRQSADGFHKSGRFNAEAVRELDDIEQANVSLAPLHPAHVVAVQVGQLRELFLRESTLQPDFAYTLAEDASWVRVSHADIIGSVTTMSLHTMSVIRFARLQCFRCC